MCVSQPARSALVSVRVSSRRNASRTALHRCQGSLKLICRVTAQPSSHSHIAYIKPLCQLGLFYLPSEMWSMSSAYDAESALRVC